MTRPNWHHFPTNAARALRLCPPACEWEGCRNAATALAFPTQAYGLWICESHHRVDEQHRGIAPLSELQTADGVSRWLDDHWNQGREYALEACLRHRLAAAQDDTEHRLWPAMHRTWDGVMTYEVEEALPFMEALERDTRSLHAKFDEYSRR